MLCFVGLLVGFGLVGSHDSSSDVREIEMTHVDARAYANIDFHHFRSSTGYDRLQAPACSDTCKVYTVAGLVVSGLVIGLSVGLQSATYRVYNRESSEIYLYYRPGCGNKDCVRTVDRNEHAKITSDGHLTRLCAQYVSWDKHGYECATQKGLKNSDWYVHDHLTFSRGENSPSSTNITAENFRSYENNTVVPYHNLRGAVDLENK